MSRHQGDRPAGGFTLIELMITLALVGVVAWAALPLFEVTSTRAREVELRQALRVIRAGLDAYKAAVDTGKLARVSGESGYPASLDLLTESLEVLGKRDVGLNASLTPERLVILRRLPRDPFFSDAQVPAAQTWNTRSYGSRANDPQAGADVFDVTSKSLRVGLDGTLYAAW